LVSFHTLSAFFLQHLGFLRVAHVLCRKADGQLSGRADIQPVGTSRLLAGFLDVLGMATCKS